jgi:hypothetical protein
MKLEQINKGLPKELTNQLMSNETIYYFSYLSMKGGCGVGGKKENYWIALSDKRVLYKTKVLGQNKNYIERDGIIPFDKISFLEVSEVKTGQGCRKSKGFVLNISSSGGQAIIPIPTKEKGHEIRQVFSELNNR